MKKLLISCSILAVMTGCSDRVEIMPESTDLSNLSAPEGKYLNDIAKQLVEVSKRMTINPNLILDTHDQFENDLLEGSVFDSNPVLFDEFGDSFNAYYAIPSDATQEFLKIIYHNKEYLLENDPSGEQLRAAIYEEFSLAYANSSPQKVIFNTIYEISGSSNCGAGVMAAFADTAISAVVMVGTAPTGVGAVVGWASLAGSYSTLVYRAAKCKGRNYH
ncbi:hypothetical protein P0M11_08960 [Kaistella sp. PBT33-4]|nr:hypothetical protein [Kaistella sp. PBT33-4]MDF0720127.1 hypothetical protein [Kaistella sp. PBT33-4]